jgi:hypothetical protein
MPRKSDDSPEFIAKQSGHAQKIKMERTMMDVTGLNRSELRRLKSFEDRINAERPPGRKPFVPPPAPVITHSESSVGGAGLGSPSPSGNNKTPTSTTSFVGIVTQDGILKYATINGSVGDDV